MTSAKFKAVVWRYYRAHGRHNLPWRQTKDVYKILVSEVMLQQTQVERVIPLYTKFIKQFPTAKKLAAAPLSEVLKAWQGLGYNRRAKLLRAATQELVSAPPFGTRLNLVKELEKLPGVGPYTARAIAAFAYNQDAVVIETNIRTAIIHHFFTADTTIYGSVSDSHIQEILAKLLPKGRAREWYSALMDYGAYLKSTGVSHNAKSKTYTKQSKFAGSLREARGAILREFTRGVSSRARLVNIFGPTRKMQMKKALEALIKEGLIT